MAGHRIELESLIQKTRGGHMARTVLKRIASGEMSEEEAREWIMILRNLKSDAHDDGELDGKRKFARMF